MSFAELMQYIFMGGYAMAAFCAALVGCAVLAVMLHAETLWSKHLLVLVPPLIAIGIAISALMSGRDLRFAGKHIEMLSSGGGGGWVARMITLCILAVAMARMIGQITRGRSMPSAPGARLYCLLLFYIVTSTALPSMFGTVPTFQHSIVYPFIIFTAAWAARRDPLRPMLIAAKWGVWVLMVNSLDVVPIKPNLVLQPDFHEYIPFLSTRLWGLGSNPNSIGPLALLGLMLEYLVPTRWNPFGWDLVRRFLKMPVIAPRSGFQRFWRRAVVAGPMLVVLFWAQSKTAWLASLVVFGVLAWFRWGRDSQGRMRLESVLAITGFLTVVCAAMLLADPDSWDRLLSSKGGYQLSTASGRLEIWQVALDEWERSPLFGYGLGIWGAEFRADVGMPYAFSAHNQFLQTLSSAGGIGFVALVIYIVFAAKAALRMGDETRGVSVALFAMIFLRCFSENPLLMVGLIDGDVLTHFVFFVMALRAGHHNPEFAPVPPLKRSAPMVSGALS